MNFQDRSKPSEAGSTRALGGFASIVSEPAAFRLADFLPVLMLDLLARTTGSEAAFDGHVPGSVTGSAER
jgi:hypothetical protein